MNYYACSPNHLALKTLDALTRRLRTQPRSSILEPEGQAFMQDAQNFGLEIRCGCKAVLSSPLFQRPGLSGKLHLVCRGGTQHEHSRRCVHSGATSLAASLGLPAGSVEMRDGEYVLNLRSLFGSEEEESGGGGSWQGNTATLVPRLYSLGWFLLAEAGLTTYGPADKGSDPWRILQGTLRHIRVASSAGSLEGGTLLPTSLTGDNKANFAKLFRAAQKKKPNGRVVAGRMLFASILPAFSYDSENLPYADLTGEFGVYLTIYPDRLSRARSQCRAADAHFAAGHPVLVIGMATVRDKRPPGGQNPVIKARVEQIALIPVGDTLTPTPSESHWHRLEAAIRSGGAYRVEPEEDAIIAMRCGPRT